VIRISGFVIFIVRELVIMSDIVDDINKEFDDWVSVLDMKLQKLKLVVRFSDIEVQDQLLELIDDIRNTEIKL
jgi:hypothetical protein